MERWVLHLPARNQPLDEAVHIANSQAVARKLAWHIGGDSLDNVEQLHQAFDGVLGELAGEWGPHEITESRAYVDAWIDYQGGEEPTPGPCPRREMAYGALQTIFGMATVTVLMAGGGIKALAGKSSLAYAKLIEFQRNIDYDQLIELVGMPKDVHTP